MKGKVVVVTGANSGIGKMTAVGLARAHLNRVGLAAADVAAMLVDWVHGGEGFSHTTTAISRALARVIRVEVAGIEGAR